MNKVEAKKILTARTVQIFDKGHAELLSEEDYNTLVDALENPELEGYTKYLELFDEYGNPVNEVSTTLFTEAKNLV